MRGLSSLIDFFLHYFFNVQVPYFWHTWQFLTWHPDLQLMNNILQIRVQRSIKKNIYNNMAKAISSNLSQTLENVNSSINNLGTPIWSRRHPLTMAKISLATRLLAGTEEPQSRNVLCEILFKKCYRRVFIQTKNAQIFIYSALNGYLCFISQRQKLWLLCVSDTKDHIIEIHVFMTHSFSRG